MGEETVQCIELQVTGHTQLSSHPWCLYKPRATLVQHVQSSAAIRYQTDSASTLPCKMKLVELELL